MGSLWVILAALLWSAVGPLSRLALAAGLQPLEIAMLRAAIAGAAFTLYLGVAGGSVPRVRDLPWVALFAVVGVALLFVANQLAVRAGGAALATILLYTAPVWVTIAAPLLGERVGLPSTLGALAAAAGVALLSRGDVRPSASALAFGLLSGVAYAFHSLLGKRLLARTSPQGLYATAMPLAAVTLSVWGPRALPSARQLALVVALGLVSFLASLSFARGLRLLPASRASLLASLEPVGAALLAAALFGERLGPWGMAGGLLAVAGVAVPTLWRASR